MRRIIFYLLLAAVLPCTQAYGQTAAAEVTKETIAFAEKDGRTLWLDKYETPGSEEARPVVLFAFGGGFYTGDRADKYQIPYFEFLARNGFVVLSTDYRTMLKELDVSKVKTPVDFLDALQGAIDTAVVDFCDAARYAIDHAEEWNIDPSLIVASGSSAGAITALQAEYDICNGRYTTGRLPEDFNFAGVVSFAGAISDKGRLHWDAAPCPIMLFHGNADTVANASHEIAGIPMQDNHHDILSFLTRQVLGGEELAVTVVEAEPGAPTREKRYSILDYLRVNTGR